MNETKIIDKFNRVHDYLRISLTERCNLRCFYCMPEEGIKLRQRTQFMSFDEVIQMAKTFVSLGVTKIRLTGGEPLVRNDSKKIIRELSKLPVELAITTNGILVNDFIPVLKESNIKNINVSLDSLKKETFNSITRRDYFDKVISNINLLLQNKFHVKINVVLIKGVNDNEVTDFVEWTKDKNIHIRFIEFMPFDGNKWNWSRGVSLDNILNKTRSHFGEKNIIRLLDGKNDTAKNYTIASHTGTFAVISSITNPFCDNCNRMRLTADGKMKNCLFSASETDLLSELRAGKDIKPLILNTVWNKKAWRAGINTIEDFSKQKNRTMVAIGG